MTTAQKIFELTIAVIASLDSNGKADGSDNKEYKNRAMPLINILAQELYPYSDTFEMEDEGRPTPQTITEWNRPIDLDDKICVGVMPYGLAALLLLAEDPATASFCQQRYEELRDKLQVGMPASSTDVEDVYGGFPYNDFGRW